MGRLTSYWDAFVLPPLLLVVLVLLPVLQCVTSDIVFPSTQPCTLHTGEQGRCLPIHECPPVLQTVHQKPPVSCGFEGFTQIVCCPKGPDTTTEDPTGNLVDISPPPGYNTQECGKSATKKINHFNPEFSLTASHSALRQRRQAGLPKPLTEAFEKHLGELAKVEPAVVGGIESHRAAWPWMALIGKRDALGIDWFCGGALISDRWVLTALHCFHDFKAEVVRLGEHNYEDDDDGADPEDIDVAEVVLYPDYEYPQAYHDLALLRLSRAVTLQPFILPVCLPWGRESEEDIVNSLATIVGWGYTLYGGFPSPVLREAAVQVFPTSRCDASYSSLPHYSSTWTRGIGEETLCAGDPDGGKDSCKGDSGGPLVTRDARGRYVAAGVVSRGHGCGHKDYPGLYVNLRHPPYLAWIKKVAFGPQ